MPLASSRITSLWASCSRVVKLMRTWEEEQSPSLTLEDYLPNQLKSNSTSNPVWYWWCQQPRQLSVCLSSAQVRCYTQCLLCLPHSQMLRLAQARVCLRVRVSCQRPRTNLRRSWAKIRSSRSAAISRSNKVNMKQRRLGWAILGARPTIRES